MIPKRDTVVGRGQSTQSVPTSSTPSAGPKFTSDTTDRINTLLKNSNINISTFGVDQADVGIVGELNATELKNLGTLLNSMGYNLKVNEDVKTLLISGNFPEATIQPNYNALVKYIQSQQIPNAGNQPSIPTQTITQYSDKQLLDISNAVAQNFLKRNLDQSEVEAIMPKLKSLVEKGTTTTTKRVGGKNVVTVTPGFSQQAAQGIVESELQKTAQADLQVKQYQDFADWLSQNMAGM